MVAMTPAQHNNITCLELGKAGLSVQGTSTLSIPEKDWQFSLLSHLPPLVTVHNSEGIGDYHIPTWKRSAYRWDSHRSQHCERRWQGNRSKSRIDDVLSVDGGGTASWDVDSGLSASGFYGEGEDGEG
ncbi:hypothetical protein C1H46_020778 [Malus baccata]|uniref:Uncharacterized protein n=1 Tax=Malus baccata TaxID=106549 RepID=A0A540M4E5_MALBA|nr:hypothetical protein C1H46_020778 [Malus baccata]